MDKERKKVIRRWVFIGVVCFLWIAFIWGNSLADGDKSIARSWDFLYKVQPLLDAMGIPRQHQSPYIRKFAHVAEFAVLGGLLYSGFIFLFRGSHNRPWKAPVCALVLSFAFGCIDEAVQYFIPGRGSMFSDVIIDTFGAALAISILGLIRWIRAVRRKKRGEPPTR